ncbi:MAG: HIT family protein [Patescibacteria group bacterium]
MRDPNCIFCKIVDGKIPAEKLYEDSHALAFLDLEPRAPGHTLIVPKYHAETLETLPEEDAGPLFSAVKKVAKMLMRGLEADGATIGINQGAAAGQVVGHLHVHVLPRYHSDGGGAIQSVVNNKPKESLGEIKSKILKIT